MVVCYASASAVGIGVAPIGIGAPLVGVGAPLGAIGHGGIGLGWKG